MKLEQDLFAFAQKMAREITPLPERSEPVVWFREVRLLRRLELGEANEVRRITLRKGLNIVWAPPELSPVDEEPELYGDGLSGHASGKTLFCRILRYLLGEAHYAPKALRESVEEKFPEDGLWAIAEVFVNGKLWLVARRLAGGPHRFATPGATCDDFLVTGAKHGDYNQFQTFLENAVCSPISKGLPEDRQLRWRFVLPWLARDQEARFSGLVEWRSPLAESENPQTSAGEQNDLIKTLLSLLDAREMFIRAELGAATTQIEHLDEAVPGLRREADRDYQRLLNHLKRCDLKELTGLEDIETLSRRGTAQLGGVREAIKFHRADPKLDEATKAWDSARRARDSMHGQITEKESGIKVIEEQINERDSRRTKLKASGIDNPSRLEDGYCPKTLQAAITKGCVGAPPGASLETEMNLGEILTQVDDLKQLKAKSEVELARLRSSKAELDRKVLAAEAAMKPEQTRVAKETSSLAILEDRLEEVAGHVEIATTSASALTKAEKGHDDASAKQTRLKDELNTLKLSRDQTILKLSTAFADVVRAAMGGKVDPSVSVTERGFTLSVKRGGEMSGAALETIKLLAFDLAAVLLSIEGTGHHPRFLIHDGPREADMARVIYERFFLYARRMEERFAEDECSFQYIITTTTPPPKSMHQGSKWLRLELNTTHANERLLRVDL